MKKTYDENQNPILALTGSLKDYQKELESTIELEEKRTRSQENALGTVGTKRAKEIKDKQDDFSVGQFQNNQKNLSNSFFDINGTKSLKEGLESYEKFLARRDELNQSYNEKLIERNEELLTIDQEVQTEVINKLKDGPYSDAYNELSQQAQGSMQQLVNNFNWVSDLTLTGTGKNKFIKAFDDLSKEMKGRGAEINNWNEALRQANYIYQQTGDIETYKEQISDVAEQLAELTNISKEDWLVGLTPELEGSLDASRAALQDYLENVGYTYEQYLKDDEVVVKIVEEYDANNRLITDLASFKGNKEETINFILGMKETGDFNNLSPQVQALLNGILDSGEGVSEEEISIALNLVAKMNTLGNMDEENSALMSKILNGTATDEELSLGIKINGEYVLSGGMAKWLNDLNKGQDVRYNVSLKPVVTNEEEIEQELQDQLSKFVNVNERDEIKQLFIEGKVTGIENMELFEGIIKSFPENRQFTIDFITENYGDLDGMTLVEALEYIKNYPDLTRYGIEVSGVEEAQEGASDIQKSVEKIGDAIDETNKKETKVTVNEGELQGTVEDYKELIKYSTKLEKGKYKISFVTDTENAIDEMETLVKAINGISEAFQDIPDLVITIKTATASKNLTGLKNNVEDYIKKYHKTYTTRFRTETALASKNVTGLKSNVKDYVDKYVDKLFWTRFRTETALASKNVTGLKNNIQDFVDKFGNKTFTTTFKVSRQSSNSSSGSSQGSSSVQSLARDISTNPFETEIGIAPTSVNMDNTNVSSMVNSAMPSTVSTKARLDLGEIGISTTIPTKINTSVKNLLDSIEYGVELFQELQNRIEKVNNKLSLLDTKMERAVGTKKIEYLKKQNELYKEQQKLQEELYDDLYKEKKAIRDELKDYGFTFDEQGNLRSYEEILLKMERKAEELQKAADKASDSDSKNDGASKSLEKYNEKLDRVKTLTDKYLSLHNDELADISNEWEDINNKIAENNDEIEKLVRENKLYIYKNAITEINNELDILTDKYDLLDVKMQHATGEKQFVMYNQQIELIKKQQKAQEELIESYNNMIEVYKTDLSGYGFKFDNEDNLINQKEILDSFQNSEDLEKITELMEEYIDIQRSELPDAISEWYSLDNAIKDIYDNKLELAKDIEDKITSMYEDEIEKRKEEIQSQCDKEVEAINKVKDAYEKSKEDDSYEKDKAEQEQKIADINKQIERYRKDNSTSSQAKLSELLDELKEEQENLDELIQDRKDSMISDMFDKQIERIESESEKAQEELDKEWTQEKISEMVQQALETGMFTSVTGEIRDLQSAMLEFAETSGDAIGITADKVKTELVGNLQAAMDILKEYPTIMKELELSDFGSMTLDTSKLSQNTINKSINVGDIEINVTGNGNATDIAKEVKKQVTECFDDLIKRV